jgi:PAS domain S-box-containing protein
LLSDKSSHKESKTEKQRQKLAFEVSKAGTWEWNLQTNKHSWSDEVWKVFKIEPYSVEPSYESWKNIIKPEDRDRVERIFHDTFTKGIEFNFEFHIIDKAGEVFTLLSRGQPLLGINNKPEYYYGVVIDITERTNAEEALKNEQFLIHALMDNVPDHIYFKDTESKFIRINNAEAQLFGLKDPSEAIGKTDFDFFSIEHARDAFNDEQEIIRTGNTISKEEKETWANRPDSWVLTTKMPLRDRENNIIGICGTSKNITQRKEVEFLLEEKNKEIKAQNEEYLQLNEELKQTNEELYKAKEKAEESDRLKTAFLQNMSHEIRTPMNAIMGFSQLLIDNYENKQKLQEFSVIINQRCNDLLEIINDILDIAKIESGQMPVNIEECDLGKLSSELTSFFTEYKRYNGKQHIEFIFHQECGTFDKIILTDKVKLKEIFINLINNAFKFTETGKIEWGCKLDGRNNLIFFVSDTGIGIDPSLHDFVFERFTQLNPAANKAISGTGLGLPIVKGLVNLLGGELFLESEPGKGSTFSFTLPYKNVTSLKRETFLAENPAEYSFPDNSRILIVEDHIYKCQYLKEILASKGLDVIYTQYGSDAVKLSIDNEFDLVLMDIRLPDMSGYEAIRQIKEYKPNIKIIIQTAYASQDERIKAHEAGCVGYLSKPTKKETLLDMVFKHLNR